MVSDQTYSHSASIILDSGIGKQLHYGITKELLPELRRGSHVRVLLRGRAVNGFVFEIQANTHLFPLIGISEILSHVPQDLFDLALWMGSYYVTPLHTVFKHLIPTGLRKGMGHKEQFFVARAQTIEKTRAMAISLQEKQGAQAAILEALLKVQKGILLSELLEITGLSKSPVTTLEKKGWLTLSKKKIDRSPLLGEEYFKTEPKKLNAEQHEALEKITTSLNTGSFATHLLFGVTGSGKTEVYLQAMERALALGKTVLMLVPEIALTQQTVERLKSRFDQKMALLHHRLSHGERFDTWHKIQKGEISVVIGARSALFAPLPNLGLILVDEEHESAYKQSDEGFCYHGRDSAIVRAKYAQATIVLGSATPSLESYYNALSGKYTLSTLTERPLADMPTVRLVDMKQDKETKGSPFSEQLLQGIKERFQRGEQTILFLNRRGYHTSLGCRGCGYIFKCASCDLSLTYYRQRGRLECHLCDEHQPPPRTCPKCHSSDMLKFNGVGTELVERSLKALFPEMRTLRVDGETTRHKGAHERLLKEFRTQKADLMIGTQMIAKGLHFPAVTLVGVLNTDHALNLPDFRASERVFQLITQVAGRAGRSDLKGEVLIQTYMPENRILNLAAGQDYPTFYKEEIEVREMFGFPPYTHMIKCTFWGEEEERVFQTANQAQKLYSYHLKEVAMHPVSPCGYPKIQNDFRYQFLLRSPKIGTTLHHLPPLSPPKGVKYRIDVDPLSTFF